MALAKLLRFPYIFIYTVLIGNNIAVFVVSKVVTDLYLASGLQAGNMIIQRINACFCQVTGLSPCTTKTFAYAFCFADEIAVAYQNRTDRATQAFAQANRKRVKSFTIRKGTLASNGQRIKQPRTIKVIAQVVFSGNLPDSL